MSEDNHQTPPGPPPPPSGGPPPPPPPSNNPPPPPPPGGSAPPPPPGGSSTSGGKSDNVIMLILAYLGIFALIPLLVEKNDSEVQWHAKNGICLLVAEIIASIGLFVLNIVLNILPVVGGILGCLLGVVFFFGILALHVMCIMKAVKGERLYVPHVSDYVAKM